MDTTNQQLVHKKPLDFAGFCDIDFNAITQRLFKGGVDTAVSRFNIRVNHPFREVVDAYRYMLSESNIYVRPLPVYEPDRNYGLYFEVHSPISQTCSQPLLPLLNQPQASAAHATAKKLSLPAQSEDAMRTRKSCRHKGVEYFRRRFTKAPEVSGILEIGEYGKDSTAIQCGIASIVPASLDKLVSMCAMDSARSDFKVFSYSFLVDNKRPINDAIQPADLEALQGYASSMGFEVMANKVVFDDIAALAQENRLHAKKYGFMGYNLDIHSNTTDRIIKVSEEDYRNPDRRYSICLYDFKDKELLGFLQKITGYLKSIGAVSGRAYPRNRVWMDQDSAILYPYPCACKGTLCLDLAKDGLGAF